MPDGQSPVDEQVRTAEVIAALSLATDLGIGLPLEHGLHSTLVAMRLADQLGVDHETATQTYYGCLLFYIGCTADAEIAAEMFDDGALLAHFAPVMFGSPTELMGGVLRSLGGQDLPAARRVLQAASRLPRAVRGHKRHITAMCEVAQMLTGRLGLPASVSSLLSHLTERWDGKGEPAGLAGDQLPLALRIIHVARDATFHASTNGPDAAAQVIRARAGHAFDPSIATLMADEAAQVLTFDTGASAWDSTISSEPCPPLMLRGDDIDRALAAMGDFADLLSPYLCGHSAGVAALAAKAAHLCGLSAEDAATTQRAALVHDIGRVAVSARIWQKPSPLTPDEWERVRLHAYQSERVLCRSPWLASLAPIASSHHERLDGAGYHRGAPAAALTAPARLLAAADAYHAMVEPRPHRDAFDPSRAADALHDEARQGRLDPDAVSAVLEAAGHRAPPVQRPAGLTEREAQVITLLARGLPTKAIARTLGISAKTADRHVQNAYAKIGVSSRAAAALFAMQHGLTTWGEFPIVTTSRRT